MGGARGGDRGNRLHAVGDSDDEGGRDPELRRHGRAHRPRFRGRDARGVRARRAVRNDVHPCLRGSRCDRRPGDDRARARGPGRRPGHGGPSGRRRRPRFGDRARAARRPARHPHHRRAGGGVRTARGRAVRRLHDRRRHRRQASRRADLRARQGPARRGRHRQRRGDQPGDRARSSNGSSSSSKVPAPQRSRRYSPGGSAGPAR